MPHDSKKREVKIGDVVAHRPAGAALTTIGVVKSITPGAETCNAIIGPMCQLYGDASARFFVPANMMMDHYVTLSDTTLFDWSS